MVYSQDLIDINTRILEKNEDMIVTKAQWQPYGDIYSRRMSEGMGIDDMMF